MFSVLFSLFLESIQDLIHDVTTYIRDYLNSIISNYKFFQCILILNTCLHLLLILIICNDECVKEMLILLKILNELFSCEQKNIKKNHKSNDI